MHRGAPLFVLTLSFFGRVVERSEKPEYIYVGADRCVCPNCIRMGVSGRTHWSAPTTHVHRCFDYATNDELPKTLSS